MPLLPSALPPKGEARRYVANDFFNLIALPHWGRLTIRGYHHLKCGEAATSTLNPSHHSLSMTKKPEHASSVFWLFYWRRSCTVISHFTHRRSTPASLAMSRGLAMCSFIPAFLARTMSSVKAFAVMARIGSAWASLLGRRRIALVAS